MKKLHNYLYISALIFALSCCFASCSDDDDEKKTIAHQNPPSIAGIWEATNLDDYDKLDCDVCVIRFSKNGDYEGYASFYLSTQCNFYGEYGFSDNKLTFLDYYYSGYDISPFDRGDLYDISVSGNKMTMTYAYDKSLKLKFTRISDSDFDFDDDDYDDYK